MSFKGALHYRSWHNGLGNREPIGPKVSFKEQRNLILVDWKSIYVERILFHLYSTLTLNVETATAIVNTWTLSVATAAVIYCYQLNTKRFK